MGKVSRTCKLAGTQTGTCLMVSFPNEQHHHQPGLLPRLQPLPSLPVQVLGAEEPQLAPRGLLSPMATAIDLGAVCWPDRRESSFQTSQESQVCRLALCILELMALTSLLPAGRGKKLAVAFRQLSSGPGLILLPPRWPCPASIPCRNPANPPWVRQCSAAGEGSVFFFPFQSLTF